MSSNENEDPDDQSSCTITSLQSDERIERNTEKIVMYGLILIIFMLVLILMLFSVVFALIIGLISNTSKNISTLTSVVILRNESFIYQMSSSSSSSSFNKEDMTLWSCHTTCAKCSPDRFVKKCICGQWATYKHEAENKCNKLCDSSCLKVGCVGKGLLVCFDPSK